MNKFWAMMIGVAVVGAVFVGGVWGGTYAPPLAGTFARFPLSFDSFIVQRFSNNAPNGGAGILTTRAAYRSAAVSQRQILDTVQATGNVRPVALVSVSSELSGQIREFRADFNDEVRRGDLLTLIDPLLFEIAVEQSEAQVGMARANVLKAEVALREAEADFQRREVLASRGSGSQAEMGTAQSRRDLAMAQLDDASHAQRLAEAGLRKAMRDLERTRIHSPVDGTVIQRNIEVGQTVTVGYDAPVLYTIAQDLREMQVNVSIPEAEIGRIRGGQRVEFTVDAYSDRTFGGEVLQVRMQPQTTQNVVTYTVVVTAPNPDLLLLPGMTATANVIVDESETTLAVPTAALRFRLPDEPRGPPPGCSSSATARSYRSRSASARRTAPIRRSRRRVCSRETA